MYTNFSITCGESTIVLNSSEMSRDKIDLDWFVKNLDHGVCHYDSDSKKIFINLFKTKNTARTNDWIKKYGKYFIYDESKNGIEEFHKIKVDPILKPLIATLIISNSESNNPKSLDELKAIDKDLFNATNYDQFIKFSFDSQGVLIVTKVIDYEDNCYSYALLKSIIDNNTSNLAKLKFHFFAFDDLTSKSNGFVVDFGNNSYELYDYSNRPPKGSGGPFANLLSLFFIKLINFKLDK